MNLSAAFLAIFMVLLVCNYTNSQNTKELPYKTVYLEDLCERLSLNKDVLLLDVRSQGEFDDTSNIPNLNLGRFKNAVNIDISNIENRLSEIKDFKDKEIFVYCSHSNRSRVVSKLLIDSGFTRVTNVNGGISTWVHDEIDCIELYTNALPYKLYPPKKVHSSLSDNNTVIIDIRPRDEYESKSDKEIRNIGRIKDVINIPHDELEKRVKEIDKDKKIILVDFDFSLSPKAAAMLVKNGYNNVGVMTYGLNSWVIDFPSGENFLENMPAYKIVRPLEACSRIVKGGDILFLDVRTEEEFQNKASMEHVNIGHLRNAVSIPSEDIDKRLPELEKYKDKEILVYEFGREGKAAKTAMILVKNGFTKVSVIFNGLYGLVWRQKNIKNFCLPLEYIVK